SAMLGSNPIRGRVLLKGLNSFDVDADVQAKANLEELTQLFPIDSLTLKGLFDLNLNAKGHYGNGQFPVVNAVMNLSNGYVKSLKFPDPLEQVNVKGSLLNTTGKIADTRLTIADLRLRLHNEPFVASGTVQNFDDYTWNIRAKGALDLTRITQLFPIEGIQLAGRVDTDVESKGKYSDVKAKRYERLPTRGTSVLRNVRYQSAAYPAMRVSNAALRFTPERIEVERANGYAGSSDVQVSGHLTNYLGYVLGEAEKLGGTLTLVSQKFNVNEWMSDDGKDNPNDSLVRKSVVKVPDNLNLKLNTAIGEALYDRMTLRNVTGTVSVNDEAVKMEKMAFMALGGSFQTSGGYDTKNIAKPKFDFALNLANVQILEAYQHLAVVRAILPLAQYVLGNVNSEFKINGLLGQDMIPLMNSLDGQGIIKIIQATVRDNPVLERLVQTTKLSDLNALRLKNVLMTTEIDNGKVKFQPFDLNFDPYKITISGGNGFDGAVDYRLQFDVPSGKVGTAFNQTFANWTGKLPLNVDRVKFDLKLGGTFKNPQLAFDGSSTAKNLKETITGQVRSKLEDVKAQAQEQAQARTKALRDSLNAVLNAKKRDAENRAKEFLNQRRDKFLDGLKPKPAVPKDSVLN
ncbi:MAG: AsmA-like C-terminal region-containing protein, partial [Cytophagaceae bacterium]|nr:AsmA-like C-terminal region-containing protein [Cytophagaceae bacterium]